MFNSTRKELDLEVRCSGQEDRGVPVSNSYCDEQVHTYYTLAHREATQTKHQAGKYRGDRA